MCDFLILPQKNDWYSIQIVFLHKYSQKCDHLQLPEAADFFHGGRIYLLSYILQYGKYILFFRGLTFQEAVKMQSEIIYIVRQQATVAQQVALRPIFELCADNTGYKGGGCRRQAWWHQGAADKQLRAILEEVSWESRSLRQREVIVTKQVPGRVDSHSRQWVCWYGDGRCLGGWLTLCGRWRCWD